MRKIISILFCLTVINVAAQDSTSIYHITNQLGASKSSKAIYKGTWLTNLNYNYSEVSNSRFGEESLRNGIGINAGYGISKRVDVRMGYRTDYIQNFWKTIGGPDLGKGRSSSLCIGSKVSIFTQKKWRPQIALSADYFYTLAHDFNDRDRLELAMAWSYKLGSQFRLGGNFGLRQIMSKLGGGVLSPFYGTINTRYEIYKGLGVFLDIGLHPGYYYYSVTPEIGAYYRLNENMQIHFGYNQFLNIESDPYAPQVFNLEGGFSWLIGNK